MRRMKMPKFYASLINLEMEAPNPEEAGSIASLDITTGHIMNFLGKEFKLIVSPFPCEINIEGDSNDPIDGPPGSKT
jgi:hypothetical protein